jgi:hypothetical protein
LAQVQGKAWVYEASVKCPVSIVILSAFGVPIQKYIGRGLVDFIPSGRKKQRILFLVS